MERGVASRGGRLVTARLGRPRTPARRALGPGCEELAVTDPDASPVREARPRAQNRHGGAPRGERPSHKGRKAPHKRLACPKHAQRVLSTSTRTSLGAPPTPHSGCAKRKSKTRAQKTRRGNEEVLLGGKAFSSSFRPRRDSDE